jgi:hypothetical protein
MTQVEVVALWAGLLTGVASIVLSIVAIVTSILADRRSVSVSQHVIQSLQKIETTVAQQSGDTRQLIKAAWDKLLGAVDHQVLDRPNDSSSAKEIAQGIAAELREEFRRASDTTSVSVPGSSAAKSAHIEEVVENLEQSLEALLERMREPTRPRDALEAVLNNVSSLSSEAQALLKVMYQQHLSRNQYQSLLKSPFAGPALIELRRRGLITPVQGQSNNGKPIPCYYFPSDMGKALRAAIQLLPPLPDSIEERMRKDLTATGYPDDDEEVRD